jgi:uncharacterized protein (TIGR02391 family)
VTREGVEPEAQTARVRAELKSFVREAAPVNGSGKRFITASCSPLCGRDRAIELVERIRPILDRLYADWRTENPPGTYFEFASEHDAAKRLISRLDHQAEIAEMLVANDPGPQLSADALHTEVWGSAKTQWSTGHRHEAVLAAAKAVNSLLQSKISRRDVSEVKLVREAFSEKDPVIDKARLRYPSIADEQTRESMRQGVMEFGAGCFAAIRNPVGHLPNDEVELSEQEALERLAALSLLARWIDQAGVESVG